MTVIISDSEARKENMTFFALVSRQSVHASIHTISPILVNVISEECILGLVIKFGTIVFLASKMNRFHFGGQRLKVEVNGDPTKHIFGYFSIIQRRNCSGHSAREQQRDRCVEGI